MKTSYEEVKNRMYNFVATNEETGEIYEGKFYDFRIDPATIPEGKFMYHCRHDDDGDWTTPVTIEPRVMVNFCGVLITDKEIVFPNPNDKYIPIINVEY